MLSDLFDFLSHKEKLYCQNCGEEIIKIGGYVYGEKLYCHRNSSHCLIKSFNKISDIRPEFNNIEEIRGKIKNGEIVYYGKLENSVK